MEPTRFEEGIKERLNERKIQPNDQLWERLSAELEPEISIAKKRRPALVYWIGTAAAILLLITIGVKLTQVEKSTPQIEEVVNVTDTEEVDLTDPKSNLEIEGKTPIKIANSQEVEKNDQPESLRKTPLENSQVKSNTFPIDPLVKQKVEMADIFNSSQDIEKKINAVFAKVQDLEKNSVPLTNAEVDSLLRNAQKEILNQKYNRLSKSIDAMALLDEVEFEIDSSIKDKLFEALKKGFMEVRTAVAQRNQ